MSVPNQDRADGWRRRFTGEIAVGSTVARYGAKIAIRTISISSVPPSVMAGLRRTKVMTLPRCLAGGRTSANGGAAV